MVSEAPPFWWQKTGWKAAALWPFSLLYGLVSGWRLRRGKRVAVAVPVICVGNFTVGGAGKTPTAMALAAAARSRGMTPGFLSRGYGGTLDVTTLVEPGHHRARDVGDEPLLLARHAPTVISRRRVDGARRLVAEGADIIIMDDGFQSARLLFDFSLLVVDSRRGIGNGLMVPAGPVRAPLDEQMRHVSALMVIGDATAADGLVRHAARAGRPVHAARLETVDPDAFAGRRVLAFAGIADTAKFFRTVRETGAVPVVERSFPDHHPFSAEEIEDLLDTADQQGLELVTTAKDRVRLEEGTGRTAELAARCRVIEVEIRFDDPATPGAIIDAAVASARARLLRKTA